ncbi:YkuS family protein [Salipaludibacillus sp. CUR1]|uniref:YkuS family protein n=1 Tax=Salipaludibacillus sp. CUR1 TaxID=2820003 RepID=UPI001E5E1FC4|nr:YkuS family protein [Salipaludibacillus sp. CUR1]MCE7794772.1 YkuS family protein [Salipaludibacillus sp. CUR1]
MARVGVEPSLTDVEQALQACGYEVVSLQNEEDAAGCDCCVVSGQQQNIMGIQETSTQASVISAQGLTADEVCERVDQSVKH